MIVDQDYEPHHFTWLPNDIEGMCEIINWLDTAPNKEVLGWLTIGEGARVFTITDSNRHLWRSILFEVRAYESLILLEQAKITQKPR